MDNHHWTAPDQKVLPYDRWPSDPKQPAHPRAVIICVHGLSGAASDFWPAGERFQEHGCAVYGVQLRGMGNDPDKSSRGDIRGKKLWIDDLLEFTRQVRMRHEGIPIFWFGESLGSLVVMHSVAALQNQSAELAGVILTSPVVDFRMELPWWKYWPLRVVMCLFPWKRISLENLGDSEVKVTNRTTHKQQMSHTPHYVEYFTLRLFRNVEKMVRSSHEAAQKLRVPTLVLYTPNDVFNTAAQIEAFFQQIGSPDKTKLCFPKSFHLILHDVDRQPALDALEKWIAEHRK